MTTNVFQRIAASAVQSVTDGNHKEAQNPEDFAAT
jgi:hypothetical protein